MIKFVVGGTAYGTIPPIVDSAGLPITPTSVAAKTYKNGSTTATGESVTILTYPDADGLRGWSYNPAGESELDVWRIQIEVVIGGLSYYHTDLIQAVVVERGTDGAATLAQGTALTRGIIAGVVGASSSTTVVDVSSIESGLAVADQVKGRILIFNKDTTTAALRGQGAPILSSATTSITVASGDAFTTAPASGDTFTIY
jgi:hypothetical protein